MSIMTEDGRWTLPEEEEKKKVVLSVKIIKGIIRGAGLQQRLQMIIFINIEIFQSIIDFCHSVIVVKKKCLFGFRKRDGCSGMQVE
jgi:hypothetical protein